jgi:DNA mismatch repair protein MLH3
MDGGVIEPLPAPTRIRIRSTQILTSLSQIVTELLQNSLDASARSIEIGIDCEEWTCWVRDDGSGISKDGMEILSQGSEAGRYGACGWTRLSFGWPDGGVSNV